MGRKIKNEFETEIFDISELNESDSKLVQKAKDSLENAYAPYSNFNVGCAVVLEDGTIVKGNNQENAAYPSGLCAERVALFYIGANHKDKIIQKMAIAARPNNSNHFVEAGPCGGCRQVMLEYQNKQEEPIELFIVRSDDEIVKVLVKDLLPLAFGKDSLAN